MTLADSLSEVERNERRSWKVARLGEVCRTTSGGTPSRRRADYFNGSIPWVKSGDLTDGLVVNVEECITAEAVNNSSAKVFPSGTLLIAMYGATVGKLGVLARPAATNQAVCAVFPNEGIDTKFLFWFLRFQRTTLIEKAIGGAQPNISQGILRDLLVPILPLDVQRQIVEEIEKQFSRLDEAVANLQRVKANLKRYKAAVLKAAVEGRLTAGSIDSFRCARLGELVELNPRLPKGSLEEDASVTFVPMVAVGADDGRLDVKAIRSYSEVRKGYTYFADNDVLFAKVTPCMENGKIAVASGLLGGIGFGSTEFHVLRPMPNVDPRYVYCIVSSESFRKEAARHMTGAVGLRRVPSAFLESVEVSVPPLNEQLAVVSEVDRHLTIIRELEAEVDVNLRRSNVLRQSVLKTAFGGGKHEH